MPSYEFREDFWRNVDLLIGRSKVRGRWSSCFSSSASTFPNEETGMGTGRHVEAANEAPCFETAVWRITVGLMGGVPIFNFS